MNRRQKFEVEQCIGYRFNDAALLLTALTHSSYANEHGCESNERLEFLGDSILSFAVTTYMYSTYPDRDEGVFSKVRSKIVSTESIACIIERTGLDRFLRLGNSEQNTGKSSKRKIFANLFEAVIGAIYLDGGLTRAVKCVLKQLTQEIDGAIHADVISDYKTALYELVQSHKGSVLEYRLLSRSGPDHDPTFRFEVQIDHVPYGEGSGHSKAEAQLEASKQAYLKLTTREKKQ